MIEGIGIDIIEIARIKQSVDTFGEKFLNKIFTSTEIEYCMSRPNKYQHLAARFAGKEAVVKAMASVREKGFNWKDIEIYNEPSGKPVVKLYNDLLSWLGKDKELKITMSHSEHYVTCFAIVYHKIPTI